MIQQVLVIFLDFYLKGFTRPLDPQLLSSNIKNWPFHSINDEKLSVNYASAWLTFKKSLSLTCLESIFLCIYLVFVFENLAKNTKTETRIQSTLNYFFIYIYLLLYTTESFYSHYRLLFQTFPLKISTLFGFSFLSILSNISFDVHFKEFSMSHPSL